MASSDCDGIPLLKRFEVMLDRILQSPMKLRKNEEGGMFPGLFTEAGDLTSMSSKSGISASQSSSKIPDGRPPSKQSFLRPLSARVTTGKNSKDCVLIQAITGPPHAVSQTMLLPDELLFVGVFVGGKRTMETN